MSTSPSSSASQADAICHDVAQIAAHMRQCQAARGAWSGLTNGWQHLSAATAGRLVTMACVAAVLAGTLTAFR